MSRYAATAVGQPGVYAAVASSGIAQSVRNQLPGLAAGEIAEALSANLASRTVYKIGFTGYGLIQAEGTARQIASTRV